MSTTNDASANGKPTPLPWQKIISKYGDTSNAAKAGVQISIQGPTGPDVCWIKFYGDRERAEANADFIVACCNASGISSTPNDTPANGNRSGGNL